LVAPIQNENIVSLKNMEDEPSYETPIKLEAGLAKEKIINNDDNEEIFS
jgi:hypothetical protein